jgi:hypothetical protein
MTAAPNTVTPQEVIVFISYSWDSEERKKWALAFATQLRRDGINAIIDEMHLLIGGRSPEFMERSVRESEFVLVVCTENYKRKFDNREGGAGYEGHIITGEIVSSIGKNKFIPVLGSGDWNNAVPSALLGIRGVDLRQDSPDAYRSLVRRLYGLPEIPPIGSRPAWVHDTGVELLIDTVHVADSSEFLKQRKKLPETDILRKIWSKPHWKIWIRPSEFKKARFRDLEQCRAFILSSYVPVRGWLPYPWFSVDSLETGDEWIAGEIDEQGRTERWALCRSGQFVHSRAFDEVPRIKEGVHVLEVLDTVTGAVEFAARMADFGVLSPEAEISFELHGVDGKVLNWPQDMFGDRDLVGSNRWCQAETINVERRIPVDDLKARRRELALELSLEIYDHFGWSDPPRSPLEAEQQKRFG